MSVASATVLLILATASFSGTQVAADTPGLTIAVGYEETGADSGGPGSSADFAAATEASFAGAQFPIYEQRAVLSLWAECPTGGECYTMGPLIDRVFFNLEWDATAEPEATRFVEHRPTIALSDAANTRAVVGPLDAQAADGSASFRVEFDCTKSPGVATLATVTIRTSDTESVVFGWRKKCGQGPHPKAELGLFLMGEQYGTSLTDAGEPKLDMPLEDKGFAGTPFYLALRSPGTYLAYEHPTFESADSAVVSANMDGHVSGGQVSIANPVTMFVRYECKSNGTTELTMTVPIPPFDPLIGRWKKSCLRTNSPARNAVVAVTLSNDLRTPVVRDGKPTAEFDVAGKSDARWSLSTTDRQFHVVVENTGRIDPLTVSGISTYTSAPNVAMTSVVQPPPGYTHVGAVDILNGLNSVTLQPDQFASFAVRIICKASGVSDVYVSVMVEESKPVEFAVRKECSAPRIVRRRGMTAGKTMSTMVFILALCGLGLSCAGVRRAHQETQAASQTPTHSKLVPFSEMASRGRPGALTPIITLVE